MAGNEFLSTLQGSGGGICMMSEGLLDAKRIVLSAVIGLWLCCLDPLCVFAAEAAVRFGSESYVWIKGEVCPLGVYFDGSIAVAHYSVCLEYDPEVLEYLDGADRAEGNRLWVEGGGGENGYKRMLHFRPLEEGGTVVYMAAASGTGMINTEDGAVSEEEFTIGQLAQAPINIQKKSSSRLAVLEAAQAEGMEEFSPDVLEYHMQVGYEVERLEVEYRTEEEGASVTLSGTELTVGSNVVTVTVKGEREEPVAYTLYVERKGDGGLSGNGDGGDRNTAGNTEAGDGKSGRDSRGSAVGGDTGGTDGSGKGGSDGENAGDVEKAGGEKTDAGNLTEVGPGGAKEDAGREDEELRPELLAALLAVLCMSVFYGLGQIKGLKRKKKPAERRKKRKKNLLKVINMEKTAIEVRHVSMSFRMAQDEASSLKEYIIRVLKRQNHYRTLQALRDVSFEVKQGEVVGIIGTNGSGKSTLLKIIAGALLPTEGEVIADRRKVQILTLGTGFDMELTARENVYLNGAIIGYSKEFIDEKFDDIVAFAELEGFMDERMRNFSSGMVSRLGFAIATVRDSADILILDEVLSVGDMFFREKSEARIREMIHSGATVLIVSHSSSVIRKNCDTAVWIEKGVLQMAGKPEVVCGAYEQMGRKGF